MAIVSFLILKMLMLVSVCEKAFGKIGKDEKGKGGIHSGAFLNLLIFPYVYGQEVKEILCFRRKYTDYN